MKTKKFYIIYIEALVCYFITCWGRMLSIQEHVWMDTVAFFLLSMLVVKMNSEKMSVSKIGAAVIMGRLSLDIVILSLYFYSSLSAFVSNVPCCVAIILGCSVAKRGVRVRDFIFVFIAQCAVNIWSIHVFLPYLEEIWHQNQSTI